MAKPSKSRGDVTRQALIISAIEIFGRDGFHAASTREIARQAEANQAAIGYHFGGKDALYHAAIKYIAARIGERIGPITQLIREKLDTETTKNIDSNQTQETDIALLMQLMNGMLRMLAGQESSSWAKLILREQQSPTAAFDVFYEGLMGQALKILTLLVSRIRHIDSQSAEARLLAITVFGQVIVFRASREAVLRYMGWKDFREGEIEIIQAQIQRNIIAMLTYGEGQ